MTDRPAVPSLSPPLLSILRLPISRWQRSVVFLILVSAALTALSACVSSRPLPTTDRQARQPRAAPSPQGPGRGPDEERALLLLIEDRRLFEPITVDRALLASTVGGGEVDPLTPGASPKERLALALGRIGNREGLLLLEEFLLDPLAETRRVSAFSFLVVARRGQLPPAFTRPERGLYAAVSDSDPRVARLALQTLVSAGAGLGEVLSAIERRSVLQATTGEQVDELDVWQILAPALSLMGDEDRIRAALLGLERLDGASRSPTDDSDPSEIEIELLRALVPVPSALLVESRAALLAQVRRALTHPRAEARQLAAQLASQVGERSDVGPLVAALRGSLDESGPQASLSTAAEQLEALEGLLRRGVASPPASFRPLLIQLIQGSNGETQRVRQAAVAMADLWLLDDSLGDLLVGMVEGGLAPESDAGTGREPERGRDRGQDVHRLELARRALLALARAEHPRAAELVSRASRQTSLVSVAAASVLRSWRLAAATGAGLLGVEEPLDRLAGDPDPVVRAQVLRSRVELLALALEHKKELLVDALTDPSTPVRRTAYRILERTPILELGEFARGLDRLPVESIELRLAAIDAAATLASGDGLEHGAAIALLEQLAKDPAYPVRRHAARVLEQLGRPLPIIDAPRSRRGPDYYRGIVRVTGTARDAVLETTSGDLRLRFHCPAAPQSCVSILQLATQGFYDGLSFYRPQADDLGGLDRCLIGTGDPQGDLHGGPGYLMGDESVPRLADAAGRVLLDRTVPDSGASRLLLTRCARPDLNGDRPVIAEVVEGLEVLEALTVGDVVLSFREVPLRK